MIVLVGASASGKTEVAKLLAKKYGIKKIITTTTRKKRQGEVDGKDYFFISSDLFKKMIKEDLFVEYTIYNGNYYGSRKDQIEDNKCVVVDPKGLNAYKKIKNKNIFAIVLLASEKTRYERMISRGDKIEDAKERIFKDKQEFSMSKLTNADGIVNTENHTIEEVCDIVYKLYLEFKRSSASLSIVK